MKFTQSDIKKLSGKKALFNLLSQVNPNFEETLKFVKYEEELKTLQMDLINLQNWVVNKGKRILILCEGGEFAGKSGLIRAFTDHLNPRLFKSIALPKPNNLEVHQWYFRRYVKQLPQKGEIVFFDRSWYNRAIVEPVNGFCSKKEYSDFMNEVNHFETLITNNELILFKIYLKISKREQAKRLEAIKLNPLRYWEMTEVDKNAQKLWDTFKKYEKKMLNNCSTKKNPWLILDGDNKKSAQLEAIRHVLNNYKSKAK